MKTKKCTKCCIEKSLSEFTKDKTRKDGLYCYCKDCLHLCQQKSYKVHRKNRLIENKKHRDKNKNKISKQKKDHHKKYPWRYVLRYIKNRCNNPKADNYEYYGDRGIECRITEEELKILWFRDKAWLLNQPSIDRKDNDGHYEFDNCQFIELSLNVIEGNKRRTKTILQFTKDGDFIKEWDSITKASKYINKAITNISSCCSGKNKTCGGFIWKYK